MDLIILCGPAAAGKMTVGQELSKLTGYKLFYNHLSLELVNQFFDFGTSSFKRLDKKIRFEVFEEIAQSDIGGLIFTVILAFSEKEDEEYLKDIIAIFEKRNPQVYIVELDCDLNERLRRNRTENRLEHKASKRNVAFSDKLLLTGHKNYSMNSHNGEFAGIKVLTIENTKKSAREVAEIIIDRCGISR